VRNGTAWNRVSQRVNILKACWRILPLFIALVVMAADDPAWKSKQIPDWTEDDAKDMLADSAWVKSFTTAMKPQQNTSSRRGGFGGGGFGGIGMGGRRGGGYPGGGYPNSGQSTRNDDAPKVMLRWESAMPVRTAELKVHDNDVPVLDEKHYAIAVYGVPDRMLVGDTKKLEDQLKGKASIKRDGKKDFKPSSVEVLERPDGPVVVYMFPMTTELTKQDHRLEFDADIGRLQLTQSFFTDEMVWQGKLEL
jgi:hypothetical protein